jgi:DNA-binding XRE family transcriptional regulator
MGRADCLEVRLSNLSIDRHELGMAQEELACLSGVSRRTMNACLSGHTEISLRLLLRIPRVFHRWFD